MHFFFDMLAKKIIENIEEWAPKGAAWDADNVGIQAGNAELSINNILLTLELTEESLAFALEKECNFIFTHHPLIFKPLKSIQPGKNITSRLLEILIKNDILLYSAHTNLDFTKNGVSFELAEKLGLKKVRFLKQQENNQCKIIVFVPASHTGKVSSALFEAGAGRIGEYEMCSFTSEGKGSFLGSEKSNPSVGEKNHLEHVDETRLEVLVDNWNLSSAVRNMLASHPYEEPAFDIVPLKNSNTKFGYGAVGEIENELEVEEFMSHVSDSVGAESLRFCDGNKKLIKTVAVCGGSGSELIGSAISSGADAFITGDIKYHPFHDAAGKILLIDAGHYETEIHALDAVERRLSTMIEKENEELKIIKYPGKTNPIKVFKK